MKAARPRALSRYASGRLRTRQSRYRHRFVARTSPRSLDSCLPANSKAQTRPPRRCVSLGELDRLLPLLQAPRSPACPPHPEPCHQRPPRQNAAKSPLEVPHSPARSLAAQMPTAMSAQKTQQASLPKPLRLVSIKHAVFCGFYSCRSVSAVSSRQVQQDNRLGKRLHVCCSTLGEIFMIGETSSRPPAR